VKPSKCAELSKIRQANSDREKQRRESQALELMRGQKTQPGPRLPTTAAVRDRAGAGAPNTKGAPSRLVSKLEQVREHRMEGAREQERER